MKKSLIILTVAASFYTFAQENPKEAKIEEVTITKTKKAVEQKADRTIFDFSEQPQLNSGTLMEGVKKLPGLVVTDIAGMMYQGKLLEVYMDGRPLNINSNELTAFLEGLPGNAVERIEIITQPGAEFPATSGGAILNIITSKAAKNYLSATYSGNYTFSNYDKFRSRTNNSVSLNARNKLFGWQLNFGQNYRESIMSGNIDNLSFTNTDRIGRGYFVKGAVTFDAGIDRVLLNYDYYHNNNDNTTKSYGAFYGINYSSDDVAHTLNNRHEIAATYQKRFDDAGKKLDFKFSNTFAKSDFEQFNLNAGQNLLENESDMAVSTFRVDYSQPVKILDEGKISVGGLYEMQTFDTKSYGLTNLDYQRQTASSYLELQATLKKFDFILGTRAEDYDISGITRVNQNGSVDEKNLTPFKEFRLFPNASIQYNFIPRTYLALNYNKKINLPSISALNPNNTTFQNPNSVAGGNPELQPTIFDNYEVKISAFDYAFIGYNVSIIDNQVTQAVFREGDVINSFQMNVPSMKIHNFNVGLPVPFMIFTKPFSEIMKFNFNPDKINFMYLYAGYQKHEMPDFDSKGFWMFNIMSQFILPKDIKMVANYFYIPASGNYFYFTPLKPIGNSLNITLSKKFMDDRLNVSLVANDIFNGQSMSFRSTYREPYVSLWNKYDSRNFGISINYKIPTKNKLAKEAGNLLNQEKKEEGGLINQGQ